MTELVIGIDGGGSRTRVVVADTSATALATAEGPGSAVRPGAVLRSIAVLHDAIRVALAQLTARPGRVRMLCAGLAGVGRDPERSEVLAALQELDVADEVVVVPDASIALEDAFGDSGGVLLIAGTGSVAFGRGPTGTIARCGGWGPVCGDEGSAAWIGRRALGVVTASHDSREPETDLTAPLLAAAGVGAVHELVAWAASATPAHLGGLAPTVLEVAATGDLRANSLVTLAVEELGLHVRTLARRLFSDERAAFPLALSGGLLTRGSLLRKRLEQRLRTMAPGAQVRAADVVPERGAVRLALKEMGVPVPEPQPG
jgi:glucosamine kinase